MDQQFDMTEILLKVALNTINQTKKELFFIVECSMIFSIVTM
jgi:hypothetical protein